MTFDAGVTENLHKPFVKEPGKTARKMSHTMFNKEVAQRIARRLFELQCRNLLGIPEDKTEEETRIAKYEHIPPHRTFYVNGNKPSSYVFPAKCDALISFRTDRATFHWTRSADSTPCSYVQRAVVVECEEEVKGGPLPRRDWDFFTELRSKKDGTIIRAHPNYQGGGPWYDWCLVQWSSDFIKANKAYRCKDVFDLKSTSNGFKEVLTHLSDHCLDAPYEEQEREILVGSSLTYYVPSKILGFVRWVNSNNETEVKAVVHCCDTFCRTNSLLTRQWRLLPGPPERGGEDSPTSPTAFVDIKDIATPIRVIEQEPGFSKDCDNDERLRHVFEVFDRRNSWGNRFVRIVRRGIPSLFKGETKKTLLDGMATLEQQHLAARCDESPNVRANLIPTLRLYEESSAGI